MSIISKIKRLVGHKVIIEPIIDYNRYSNNEHSYSGGSLAESNILIVTNIDIPREFIEDLSTKEGSSISILKSSNSLNQDKIAIAGRSLIGPFLHIINIYKKESIDLLNPDNTFPKEDQMYRVYQWLQEEVSYLVPLNQYSTICTASIGDDTQYSDVFGKNIDMCIRGLGEAMSNHNIINNGIVASPSVSIKDIVNTAIFMSSKYGQIMTGEVLHLK